jgi:2-oxoglutarate/2-oxoacid ferredoxin oxidoreductase subunit alpha
MAIEEARHQLRSERGVESSYLRLRALPLTADVGSFVAAHRATYVVEQNRDGQMTSLIRLDVGEDQRKVRPILHYDGLPVDARSISEAVIAMEG